MKRVHQPENNRSLAGSRCDVSTDEDESEALCYSPEDEDQTQRFYDLVALALASSRDHGLTQPQSAAWDEDESDCESHPSLKSDAEAELLDLFDEEDENESDYYDESSLSSPSVDASSESHDATVIHNRKLLLFNRQQLQQADFRDTDSFCTNHANVLSPELMLLVERILSDNRQPPQKDKKLARPTSKSQSSSRKAEISSCVDPHRNRITNSNKRGFQTRPSDRLEKNASVMERLRKLVYKKYETRQTENSDSESIHSSILPISPSLLAYRDALQTSNCPRQRPSSRVVPSATNTSSSPNVVDENSPVADASQIVCDSPLLAAGEAVPNGGAAESTSRQASLSPLSERAFPDAQVLTRNAGADDVTHQSSFLETAEAPTTNTPSTRFLSPPIENSERELGTILPVRGQPNEALEPSLYLDNNCSCEKQQCALCDFSRLKDDMTRTAVDAPMYSKPNVDDENGNIDSLVHSNIIPLADAPAAVSATASVAAAAAAAAAGRGKDENDVIVIEAATAVTSQVDP